MPFLRACHARRRLIGTKLGMVGFGDMRLQTTGFDVQEIHETFGVEVESIDMLELQQGMDKLGIAEVGRRIQELTSGWQYVGDQPSPGTLQKVVAAYMVLDRMAEERGYIGLSIKCPTGVTAAMGFTPCMVGCLLANKYHYVCENDIPGLLGQTILGLLSDQMSTYWELYEILSDGILFGCCGFCPTDFLCVWAAAAE
jgi:L-fucose isomerase-like protein